MTIKNWLISVLFFTVFSSLASYSQPFSSLRKYDISDGISANTVRTIIQDNNGYIWLGTKDGISKFNGQKFQNFGGYPKITDYNLLDILKLYEHSNKNSIWLGTVDGLYLFDMHTQSFSQLNSILEIESIVNDLCYDQDNNLWIATSKGLFCYNEINETTKEYKRTEEKGGLTSNIILSLLKDSSGDMWIGTRSGLFRYNKGLDKFISHKWKKVQNRETAYEINCMLEGTDGDLWIGTRYDGLLKFDRLNGDFTTYRIGANQSGNTWIRALHETHDGQLLLGTEDGLFSFNKKTGQHKHIKSLSKEVIYSFLEDHEGGTWIGTYFDGAYYIPPQNNSIDLYREGTEDGSLYGKVVSQFCEDTNGNIWIATEDEGLNHLDIKTKRFTHYTADSPSSKRISHNNLHALLLDNNRLWVGTFSKGIDIINTNNGRVVKHYESNLSNPATLPNNHIYSIYKSRNGDIYIGTMKGFCKWIPENDSFYRYEKLSNTFVYDMLEDKSGNLWIATKNDGIWRMQNGKFYSYPHNDNDSTSPGGNHIIRIHIDSRENLWFATEGNGICRYDYSTDAFVNYDHNKGLYHHIIYSILDDSEGNLWLSTNYGIVKYNPDTTESRIYTEEDGMQSNQFNYRSSLKASDGKLYFGGIHGFNSFHPGSFMPNEIKPNTIISEITLHKKNSDIVSIIPQNKITITPDVVSFDIYFECLSYISPSKNKYAYKVEKLHDDWIYTNTPTVSFVDLPAGEYRMIVKSANNDGIWNEDYTYVDFVVKDPFWKTTFAKFLYLMSFLLLVALIVKWLLKENRNKQQRERLQMEMQMEQESYRSKFQFFTHVAHEIKTPLTLIKAPLDVIIEEGKCDAHTMENLLVMKQNTDRLLELIKQLLNFRKIDKEGYTLSYSTVDISQLINSIVKRFDTSCKNISISAKLPTEPTSVNIDAEAVTKILSNLLSNGLKYAKSQITIQVETLEWKGCTNLVLSVTDDGPGISESEYDKIFEPFYRSSGSDIDTGFGIGLSLVKLLVDKLGGSIEAKQSKDMGGLAITVIIPQGKVTVKSYEVEKDKQEDKTVVVPLEHSNYNILIVEDTKEMLDFLIKNLSNKFIIHGAANGKEALDILSSTTIDLVVSDVMMPEMDGFELLYNIRSDKMLCHIPVILLSAQANVNSKITGLDYGADAYIEKPFSINHVIATIDNLLKNRKLLFERFSTMPNFNYGNGGMNKGDIEWLEGLTEIIKKNLTNEKFTVDTLASEMAISRSNLRRKVIGVTGLPPNDYIRLVRLKVAAVLLKEGKYRVNEVCYQVGFSSHSYFTTCFQKQFGVLPKDFTKD